MDCDLLVLGAGAAGMTTAAAAHALGLRVIACEASPQVGGTTATSAGTAWIPLSHHAATTDVVDNEENVLHYLGDLVGPTLNAELVDVFLKNGPSVVRFLEANTHLSFRLAYPHPDYRQGSPGATISGRALAVTPFDGRLLGNHFADLRPPREEFLAFGGMMVGKEDLALLLHPLSSISALKHSLQLLGRFAVDRVRYGRGTRLVMGNAMVGRLYYTLLRQGVPVLLRTRATRLLVNDGRVVGAEIIGPGGAGKIMAAKGVVLAGGGLSTAWIASTQLGASNAIPHPLIFEGNQGQTVEAALAIGASLEVDHQSPAFWMPVSTYVGRDNQVRAYAHIVLDRAKPGIIAVDSHGRRFTDEAVSYHDFVLAMQRVSAVTHRARFFLMCDALALKKYGLGAVLPGSLHSRRFVNRGYLHTAQDIGILARQLSVPVHTLTQTVARFDEYAREGHDPEFGRGTSALALVNGDPNHRPNASLGLLCSPPFFAVELSFAPLAASAGLSVNRDAQVLRSDRSAIAGLYACGNDMASIMRGAYPGPGINLGPALVFACQAAKHLAGEGLFNALLQRT
jgi:hypothetical protein